MKSVKRKSRNSKSLKSFTAYCKVNPEQRFWQALRNWAKVRYIVADDEDTYYWGNE